jgi:hypothetical protein
LAQKRIATERTGVPTSAASEYGVNVACLKGVSSFDFADVLVIAGVDHPTDHGFALHRANLHLFTTDAPL